MNWQLLNGRQHSRRIPRSFRATPERSGSSSHLVSAVRPHKAVPVGGRHRSASTHMFIFLHSPFNQGSDSPRTCVFVSSINVPTNTSYHTLVSLFYLWSLISESVGPSYSLYIPSHALVSFNDSCDWSKHSCMWLICLFYLPFLFENVNLAVDRTCVDLRRAVILCHLSVALDANVQYVFSKVCWNQDQCSWRTLFQLI